MTAAMNDNEKPTLAWTMVEKKLHRGETVLLDGGLGALLYRRGVPKKDGSPFPWSLEGLIWAPWLVGDIHAEYIGAGCDVITTGAFRTNRNSIEDALVTQFRRYMGVGSCQSHVEALKSVTRRWGDMSATLTELAIFLAHAARMRAGKLHEVAVAGNFTTLEDTYAPEKAPSPERAKPLHTEKVKQLLSGLGVDLILVETMNTIQEAEVAAEAALASGKPTWVSFILHPKDNGVILSGEEVSKVVCALRKVEHNGRKVGAVLFNCVRPERIPAAMVAAVEALDGPDGEIKLGVYANAEKQDEHDANLYYRDPEITEGRYADYAEYWQTLGARIIGGCCGTTPTDMAHVARRLRKA